MTFLYIDPGTGSMLFSLLIGLAAALVFAVRALSVKLKFILTGGRAKKDAGDRIPFVIYSDHKRYWNVFKPVCDEAERRGVDVTYYTQSPDDPALSAPYE
ncbi:MAG: CDP-glycerol--glycerophosphate glycerophosphotransferase, partial [Treponema sp.]|nr:CDP-glycerol--glycerophosphate glycerophosphotransferase [Treponema sp.]